MNSIHFWTAQTQVAKKFVAARRSDQHAGRARYPGINLQAGSLRCLEDGKGALVSERALHCDGDKPNSVARLLEWMIIYLGPLARAARPRGSAEAWCDDTRGITDRLPFLCFVLHRMGFFLPRGLLRAR